MLRREMDCVTCAHYLQGTFASGALVTTTRHRALTEAPVPTLCPALGSVQTLRLHTLHTHAGAVPSRSSLDAMYVPLALSLHRVPSC